MNETLRAAVVQMCSGESVEANLASACGLVEEAAREGAQLVVLPELFNCWRSYDAVVACAEPIPGPTSERCSELARRLGITLCAGSICERSADPKKGFNTSLLFGPDGELIARYRKIHLFDIDLPEEVVASESHYIEPGQRTTIADCGWAVVGLATCYDLRFPELFRELSAAGAEVLLVPAAFTAVTGRAHWEVLIRARAIENQSFLLAANQVGSQTGQATSYGHSVIVDPWGTVLATAGGEGEEVVWATLEAERLRDVRQRLPALQHRRLGSSSPDSS